MYVFTPTVVGNGDPKISLLQDCPTAPRVLFTLPDDAEVELPSPPDGVENKGNWGEIRRQLGLACNSSTQLPEVCIVKVRNWIYTYPGCEDY